MGFFNKNRPAPDLRDWQPEIIVESEHYAIIRLPDGFVSLPDRVLQLFERLRSLGFEVLEVSYSDRLIARKIVLRRGRQ